MRALLFAVVGAHAAIGFAFTTALMITQTGHGVSLDFAWLWLVAVLGGAVGWVFKDA